LLNSGIFVKKLVLKKILLIRFSSIGDIVLTTPVARCIKSQKKYELHALTKSSYKGIYETNPNIDKVHKFVISIDECFSDLLKEDFDFIIDLQKNIRSHRLKRKLKIPGYTFPKLNIEKWLLVNLKINKLPKIHIVDRYFEAVKHLGVINDGKGLDYFIPTADEIVINDINTTLTKGYIAFVIGGQHNTKILPPEKCAQIISGIKLPVVLLGGNDDIERGEKIKRIVNSPNIFNTCGKFNINQSSSLIKQAEVIITNDTGLMHIASAFNKRIVSIWGNTVPDFGMFPYMPENSDRFIISEVEGLNCRPCSKLGYQKCPKKHFNCMEKQDVDRIINYVNNIVL
jgi:ADP-heptose:LPS heptosyltransferase